MATWPSDAAAANRGFSAAGLNPELTPRQFDLLAQFLRLRAEWGAVHNVAGPAALDDPWASDVVDALALAQVADSPLPLIDVGAGSGTLGIALGILRRERPVRLIEPSAKRAAFLRAAVASLAAENVQVERTTWPAAVARPSWVASRAVARVPEWPEFALSGGAMVRGVVRLLGRERPPVQQPALALSGALDYLGPLAASRRVEVWLRVDA